MGLVLIASLSIVALFVCMLVCSEAGRRIGAVHLAHHSGGLPKGIGAAEGALFGLLGLLLAFTFSGAATRLEDRRHLLTDEANAIGTAYLRIGLVPSDAQPELKDLFRRYVEIRSVTYRNAADQNATKAKLAEGAALQEEIWTKARNACLRPEAPTQAAMLLLPALNEMIDITTTRVMAGRNHPPSAIFLMLGVLSLIGAVLVGYAVSPNEERAWLHTLAFAAMMSLTLYVIVDLEFPRLGLIRVDSADRVLVELRQSMH